MASNWCSDTIHRRMLRGLCAPTPPSLHTAGARKESTCATRAASPSRGNAARIRGRFLRGSTLAKKNERNLIVGLDIGTSKVLAIVGEITMTGEVEVIGVGHHPSRGMKKGVVVNIESTVQSIQRAIEEAE